MGAMFGLGGSELLVIALVALLVLGPKRLPEIARTVSAVFKELTRLRRRVDDTMSEIRQEIDLNIDEADSPRIPPPVGRPRPSGLPVNTGADPDVLRVDDYLAPPSYDPGDTAGDCSRDDEPAGAGQGGDP